MTGSSRHRSAIYALATSFIHLFLSSNSLLPTATGFGVNDVLNRRCYTSTFHSLNSMLPLLGAHADDAHFSEKDGDRQLHSPSEQDSEIMSRRDWLILQTLSSSAILLGPNLAHADDSTTDASLPLQVTTLHTVSRDKSVIVLGANGGTGRECVSAILSSGRPCIATTRSGSFLYDEDEEQNVNADTAISPLRRSNTQLREGQADVTQLESLLSLVDQINDNGKNEASVGAMIFAASASVKGKTPGVNDAFTVDYQGVINAAQCCIQRNIPRLVIVSSGAVTRPDSAVYKLLNFVGGRIMEAKIQGEDGVRELYKGKGVIDKGLGYTVVRPGGLTYDPVSLGPSFLEVNQGDDKSGRLSRADVAAICVACLDSESAWDATFECYEKNTAKPVENVGLSNILRLTDPTSYKSGREGNGDTWEELLGGLKSDNIVC